MQTRRGRIENGTVVLIDPDGVPEGTEVVVLIPSSEAAFVATAEELAIIDAGLADVKDGRRIDARAFLREIRLAR